MPPLNGYAVNVAGRPPAQTKQARRSICAIDLDLYLAAERRARHTDPMSRAGIGHTVDELLDERLVVMASP